MQFKKPNKLRTSFRLSLIIHSLLGQLLAIFSIKAESISVNNNLIVLSYYNMSHRQKLGEFRKEIRSLHLNELFATKRMVAMQSKQFPSMRQSKETASVEELKQIAKEAQSQARIEQLNRQGWLENLKQFMAPEYHSTEEQLYASLALCNLFLVRQEEPPSKMLTQNLVNILKSGNKSIISNIIVMFFNLIYDHPNWRDEIANHMSFAENLNNLFQLQGVDRTFLLNLLKTIYLTVYNANGCRSFLVLLQSLLNAVSFIDSQLLYLTLSSIYQIAKMFPVEAAAKVIESKLIEKLGPLLKFQVDQKLSEIFLKIGNVVCQRLSRKAFIDFILPIIGKKISSKKIKMQSYRLLYSALEQKIWAPSEFWKDSLREQMVIEFSEAEDSQILIQFCYIFSICLLNLGLQSHQISGLKNSFNRASKMLGDNVEIKGFIEETILLHKSLYQ